MIELLIECGADIEAKDWNDESPWTCAMGYNKNLTVIDALIRHDADINAKGEDGSTPLYLTFSKAVQNDIATKVLARHDTRLGNSTAFWSNTALILKPK